MVSQRQHMPHRQVRSNRFWPSEQDQDPQKQFLGKIHEKDLVPNFGFNLSDMFSCFYLFRSEFDHIIIKASVNGKEISREKVVKEKKRNLEEVSELQNKNNWGSGIRHCLITNRERGRGLLAFWKSSCDGPRYRRFLFPVNQHFS